MTILNIDDVYSVLSNGLNKLNDAGKLSPAAYQDLILYADELKNAVSDMTALADILFKANPHGPFGNLNVKLPGTESYIKKYLPMLSDMVEPYYISVFDCYSLCCQYCVSIISEIRANAFYMLETEIITDDEFIEVFDSVVSVGLGGVVDPFDIEGCSVSDYAYNKKLYDEYRKSISNVSDNIPTESAALLKYLDTLDELNEDLLSLNDDLGKHYFENSDETGSHTDLIDKYLPFRKHKPLTSYYLALCTYSAVSALLYTQTEIYKLFLKAVNKINKSSKNDVKIPAPKVKKNILEIDVDEDAVLPDIILNDEYINKITELSNAGVIPKKDAALFTELIEKLKEQKEAFEEEYDDSYDNGSFPICAELSTFEIIDEFFPDYNYGDEARCIMERNLWNLYLNIANEKYSDYLKTMFDIYALLFKLSKYDSEIETYAASVKTVFDEINLVLSDMVSGENAIQEFTYNNLQIEENCSFLKNIALCENYCKLF